MTLNAHIANPFAMLLNAEAVLYEMNHSESLESLAHQIHHPLDKVTKVKLPQELAAYDENVEATIGDDISDLPAEDRADAELLTKDMDEQDWDNSAYH